ncbi:hypothetical protein CsSME_00005530 [Camellia sinensis var. sinensis]
MAKNTVQGKAFLFLRDKSLFVVAFLISFLMVCALWSFIDPRSTFPKPHSTASDGGVTAAYGCATGFHGANLSQDPPERTFYDDPSVSYSFGSLVRNWDKKRREWLKRHPFFATARDGLVVVTGSQPLPCKNPIGDHLLLRLFKNKVDYCRIHGYEIFYNNAFLHPKMVGVWAKLPPVRAAMVAHPEAEWIWWVDSDAVITDMEFKLPMKKYESYNFIINGWENMIYERKSRFAMNTGIFLIRNCQWSMDFMEAWMGPQTPNYEKWGQILTTAIKDKLYPVSDDQTAMVYLLMKERERWGDKVFLEHEYCIQGYWLHLVKTLDNITRNYIGLEKKVERLRRRHAEKVSESYGTVWEPYLEEAGYRKDAGKRPCITHFTGCQQCSGEHNSMYEGDSCWKEMERALNFADNQVLRNYGFMHQDLLDSSPLSLVPFGFPA